MKILFFTYDFPYPTNTGGKNRAYNLLKYGGENVDFYLFSFTRPDFKNEYVHEIEKIGVSKIKLFPRKKIRSLKTILPFFKSSSSIFRNLYFDNEIFNQLIEFIKSEKIDLVHFESYYTSFYLHKLIEELGLRQVFGTENIEYKIYEDYTKNIVPFPLKPLYFQQVGRIKREEESAIRQADACFAVTKAESDFIVNTGGKKCFVVENGLDVEEFKFKEKKKKENKNILFVGNFTYFPNVSAVKFFYNDVFREIGGKNITFTVVGKQSKKLSFLKDSRVRTVEFVDDIKDEYYNADVFVSPVKYGGGTNFKLLEAMALGTPVVAFPQRTEDFGIDDGKNIFLASDKTVFRQKVLQLMENKKMTGEIARNARKLVEEQFSWVKIGKKANEAWRSML